MAFSENLNFKRAIAMNPFFDIGSKQLDKKLSRENTWGIKTRFQPGFCPIMKYLVGAT